MEYRGRDNIPPSHLSGQLREGQGVLMDDLGIHCVSKRYGAYRSVRCFSQVFTTVTAPAVQNEPKTWGSDGLTLDQGGLDDGSRYQGTQVDGPYDQ
jgi:hypothetical protein